MALYGACILILSGDRSIMFSNIAEVMYDTLTRPDDAAIRPQLEAGLCVS